MYGRTRIGTARVEVALLLVLLGCGDSEPNTRRAAASASRPVAELLGVADPWRRNAALSARFAAPNPETLDQVRAVLTAGMRELEPVDALMLVTFWAQRDPAPAFRWAMTRSGSAYRAGAISIAVNEWARVAPEQALRELARMDGTGRQPEIQRALVRGWFGSGQPGLETYVRDLEPGFGQQRAIAAHVGAVVERDGTEAAMSWAEALAAPVDSASDRDREKYRLALVRQTGSALALADPAAGVEWCRRHCDGPLGGSLRQVVASRWATRDAAAALAWLEAVVDAYPLERERALRATFQVCMRRNRDAAVAWVEALTDEQRRAGWRQPAIGIYTDALSWDEPEAAIKWTAFLEDDAERERALVAIGRRWRDRDPAAGDAWLEASPLSDSARADARTFPKGWKGRPGPRMPASGPLREAR